MTTIFINSLTQLVSAKLKIRWSELNGQLTAHDYGPLKLTGYVHDTLLSTEQALILDALEKKIVKFVGTGNDVKDKESIKLLIANAKKEVERVRVDHEAKSTSDTLKCLDELSNAIESFYAKLQDFSFNLLDCENKRTPELIVYSHACDYLGLSKFQPDTHCSIEIKKLKEAALLNRLDALKKAIRPEYTLEQQKETTLQALRDLARDNNDIVKPKKAITVPFISAGLSFFSVPIKAQTATPGHLDKEITLAIKAIEAMTPETSDCPKFASFPASIGREKPQDGHKIVDTVKSALKSKKIHVPVEEEDNVEQEESALSMTK